MIKKKFVCSFFFLCFDHEILTSLLPILLKKNTWFGNFQMVIIHDERCKIVFSMLWDTKEHLPYCLCLLAWLNILASKHCSVMFDCHVSRLHSLELKCKVQIFPPPDPATFDIINSKLKPREDNYRLNQNQQLKVSAKSNP